MDRIDVAQNNLGGDEGGEPVVASTYSFEFAREDFAKHREIKDKLLKVLSYGGFCTSTVITVLSITLVLLLPTLSERPMFLVLALGLAIWVAASVAAGIAGAGIFYFFVFHHVSLQNRDTETHKERKGSLFS